MVATQRICRWCGQAKEGSQFHKGFKCKTCYNAQRAAKRANDCEWRAARNAGVQKRRASDPEKTRAQRRESMRECRSRFMNRDLDVGDAHLPKTCAPTSSRGCGELKTRGDFYRDNSRGDQRSYWCKTCMDRMNGGYRQTCQDAWGPHFGKTCYLCAEVMASNDRVSVDHIVPRAAGGDDAPANLAWVHASCNSRKGARPATPEQVSRLGQARQGC